LLEQLVHLKKTEKISVTWAFLQLVCSLHNHRNRHGYYNIV